jgi:nucleoside-diphosphate-sugar epimerase
MKKLGIIGYGWLGSRIAEYFSLQYNIFATTTTPAKADMMKKKGYFPTLAGFGENADPGQTEWEPAKDLDAIIIAVPFSGLRNPDVSMVGKRTNLLKFLGDYKGQIIFTSSTGVYPNTEKEFTEDDLPACETESERFILEKFLQTNILRLGGLMGDERLLKNFRCSNPEQLVNYIHYTDICRVIDIMLKNKIGSKVYNLVAPLHPNKEEVLRAQQGLSYSGIRADKGRIISSEKLIKELDFEFQYADPRYFHL